ncbi:MAG: regulatory protein RecX [Chloroflexota bacterium]
MAHATPAIDVALRYLAQRPRSEQEVRRRLERAGVGQEAVDGVLVQLRQHGLVDDAAFAQYWLEQRQTFRPRGARLLRAELRQHGIATDLVTAAAGELASSADEDAYRAAHKRAYHLSTADERTFKSRLGQFLARRGFDWEAASTAVERLYREVSTSSGSAPAPTA